MNTYNIIILGSTGVDKSAISVRLIQGNFVGEYEPTIEDSYYKELEVDGVRHTLTILDTADGLEDSNTRQEFVIKTHGLVLVYAINDRSSFENLKNVHSKFLETKQVDQNELPVAVVGNKNDLQDNRKVTESEGKEMAERLRSSGDAFFMECSAKTGENNDEIFIQLVRKMVQIGVGQNQEKKNGNSCCSLL
eukprot:gb/GECH01010212.1/.p1 GENE.gb/GECH01010212.1/~~gb/GECH01010212.1/.p1  ORF type:complete len:192 (+),score=27.00 gb/GECH01010212.1/:1-576(+)